MDRLTVLCFGDSNTYGTPPVEQPEDDARYPLAERWPGVAAQALGERFHLIEEGLPGRTTVHDDPIEGSSRNGLAYLVPCLGSHRPLDAVVIMLGTNDLKTRFAVTPEDIARSLALLLDAVVASRAGPKGGQPRLLVVAPAPIEEVGWLGEIFEGGAAKSRGLSAKYAAVAARYGAAFLDAGEVIRVSPVDGVHFAASEQAALGRAIAEALRAVLG